MRILNKVLTVFLNRSTLNLWPDTFDKKARFFFSLYPPSHRLKALPATGRKVSQSTGFAARPTAIWWVFEYQSADLKHCGRR